MPISVDSKGNITFLPDDIPMEVIPVPEKKSDIPNPANIPGLELAYDSEQDILSATGEVPISTDTVPEKIMGTKTVETPMLNNYGEMSSEELFILFYNREKPRAADATDESLARMQKEIKVMMEILKIRERAIIDEDIERETKRSRKEKEERKKLDTNYKPQNRIAKSAAELIETQQKKQLSQKERDIKILMTAGLSREKAIAIVEKKGEE